MKSRTAPLDVVSFGEAAVADKGCGNAHEGEEVVGFALVAAVESAAAGEPGNGPLDDPAVTAEPLRALDALATLTEPSTQVVVVVALVGV